MAEPGLVLVTGAGGGVGGVAGKVVALLRQRGRAVRAMAHRDDDRADALRALGADVVVGDLTRPADVATALDSVQRMFFSMSLAPSYPRGHRHSCDGGPCRRRLGCSRRHLPDDRVPDGRAQHERVTPSAAALAVGACAELVWASGRTRSPDCLLG